MAKSTKIIAALGVAGMLGMIALPTFATDYKTVVDTVSLTVATSCGFSTGDGNMTVSPAADLAAGGVADFGSNKTHNFVVKCNENSYKVTAVATDLAFQGTAPAAHGTIEYVANDSYNEASIGDDGKWTAVLATGDTDAAISKTSSIIKSGNATTTDNFSVTYKAYAGKAQTAGTYQGTVTYTLTAPNA